MGKINLEIPIYKAKILILLGEYDDIKKHIPKELDCFGDHGYMARTAYYREPSGGFPFRIVIHSRSIVISVIAHEAIHAANYIFDAMGAKADFDNDEFLAYLVQYICEEVEMDQKIYGKKFKYNR